MLHLSFSSTSKWGFRDSVPYIYTGEMCSYPGLIFQESSLCHEVYKRIVENLRLWTPITNKVSFASIVFLEPREKMGNHVHRFACSLAISLSPSCSQARFRHSGSLTHRSLGLETAQQQQGIHVAALTASNEGHTTIEGDGAPKELSFEGASQQRTQSQFQWAGYEPDHEAGGHSTWLGRREEQGQRLLWWWHNDLLLVRVNNGSSLLISKVQYLNYIFKFRLFHWSTSDNSNSCVAFACSLIQFQLHSNLQSHSNRLKCQHVSLNKK